jgi:exopolyphosphatase / guanosine-5'-triphosphate,3'-diphosphate pyrophosphatase
MTIASIDIGTNTVLLLVGSVGPDHAIDVLYDATRTPRLGQGVDASRHLAPASVARVLGVLSEFRAAADRHHPDHTIVTATSAVRDAGNRQDFIDIVKKTTGFEVRVLSGSEEAEWTYAGTVSGATRPGPALVIDIGGGSTEVSTGTGLRPVFHRSIDIGAVRLTERLMPSTPPKSHELAAAKAEIATGLAELPTDAFTGGTAYAVAGTPTTLAAHLAGLKDFDRTAVDGFVLTRMAVDGVLARLSVLTPPEIRGLGRYFEGREDVITAGTLILSEVMDRFDLDQVRVSVRGLRYGALLAAANGPVSSAR